MTFFLSFLQSEHKYPIPAYNFWEYYIKNGIIEGGYEWTECKDADWALGLVPQSKKEHAKWKQDTWDKTIECLKENPADIFLSYLYPAQVDRSAIKEIQKMGIPCVNFFCDNVRDFKTIPVEFEVFDLNWVPEYQAVSLYQKAGYPNINLPMPMWVDPKYRVLKKETNQQVTFIGSKDVHRESLFEKLLKLEPDLPLSIYGNGWKKDDLAEQKLLQDYSFSKKVAFNLNFLMQHGLVSYFRKLQQRRLHQEESYALISKINNSISFEEYNRLTSESMITLGINRFPSFRFPLLQPGTFSRLRDIEAPMLGACYLTEYTDGIEELYDIDKEIVVYRNEQELIFKIKQLQNDAKQRRSLKINGQKRALEHHQIANSLTQIIKKLYK